MAGLSDIEWTDSTWNPVAGCAIASSGCTNCYAMRMAARLEAMGSVKYKGLTRKSGRRVVWTGRAFLDDAALAVPANWRTPKRIFVNSMSDLFWDEVPDWFIEKVWDAMAQAPWHQFQILTKRADRMAEMCKTRLSQLNHVWLGVSVENRTQISRIKALQAASAAVRFISFEPLIGAIGEVDLAGIHWAIVGGESGPKARAMKLDWVEEIQATCQEQGVAFFFKQWGGVNKKRSGRLLGGRTWDEYPNQLSNAVPVAAD